MWFDMKETERGHLYLRALYVGNRKEISKEVQQIRIQRDDIYGYIVETENGRHMDIRLCPTSGETGKEGENDKGRKEKSRPAAGEG